MIPSYDLLEQIEEQLRYNTNTGLLHWRSNNSAHKAGDPAGYVCEDGYKRVKVSSISFPHHHLCWFLHHGEWPNPDLEIDHVNRIRSDNRISNLREVDRETNQANRGLYQTNRSGHVGVHQKGIRWVAQISRDGRNHHIGTFPTMQEAIQMRAAVAELL